MRFSVYTASAQLRMLVSIPLIILLSPVISESHAAPKEIDVNTYGDPDIFANQLADYATFSDSELAGAVGNIIGHLAGMFRHYPDQIDIWLEQIRHPRLETFAVIALGLADHQDPALTFAETRKVDVSRIASILTYKGGSEFHEYSAGDVKGSVSQWLDLNGAFETMPQDAPWKQDVLWSITFVSKDGSITLRILEVMDSLAESLGVTASTKPMRQRIEDQEFTEKLNRIKQEHGYEAYSKILLEYLYIAAGGWSFASNSRFPYIAEALYQYSKEHPDSLAVKEVLTYSN